MPVHDWAKVSSGTFHNFHLQWQAALTTALNSGGLPDGYFAMVEHRAGGPIPDVLAIQVPPPETPRPATGGLALAKAPPQARFVVRTESAIYARKARRITVRDELGEVVTIIEIVSPGNKDTENSITSFSKKMAALACVVSVSASAPENSITSFSKKMAEFLTHGVNLVVVDLFPPSDRDPQGIHKAIWDAVHEEPFELPADKRLTAAGYCAADMTGYVEPFAVGDALPSVPLFLQGNDYVPCPLEQSYAATWAVMPAPIRRLLEA